MWRNVKAGSLGEGDETALLGVLAVDGRMWPPAGPTLLAALVGVEVTVVDRETNASLRAST